MEFNFEKLLVYKKAMLFVDKSYLLSKNFPKDEIFGLTSQLRRAAVSIVLNTAEGSARSRKDFCRFIDMARGSVLETLTILQIALNQNYLTQNDFLESRLILTEISKMLSSLKRSLSQAENSSQLESQPANH